MDGFDHFVKESLRCQFYIRYTDDAVILHCDRKVLEQLVPIVEQWLGLERHLQLHPRKVEIRKLSQGIDFLGYVVLPHHTVLRTRTKRRMLKRVTVENATSYLGLLEHCHGYGLATRVKQAVAVNG